MCDPSLPSEARIDDALSRMSLKDKINAMYRSFGSPFVDCDGNSGIPSLGLNGAPGECMLRADALGRAWGEHARYGMRNDGYLRGRHRLIMRTLL